MAVVLKLSVSWQRSLLLAVIHRELHAVTIGTMPTTGLLILPQHIPHTEQTHKFGSPFAERCIGDKWNYIMLKLVSYSVNLRCWWCIVTLHSFYPAGSAAEFLAFYGPWGFGTTFTTARRLSLSCARSIQSIPLHLTSWRSSLILSFHLRLGLPRFTLQNSVCSSPLPNTCYMYLEDWHCLRDIRSVGR